VFSQQAGGGPKEALPAGEDATTMYALCTTLLSQVLIYQHDKSSKDNNDDISANTTSPANKVKTANCFSGAAPSRQKG
jgi:hypothetical protein